VAVSRAAAVFGLPLAVVLVVVLAVVLRLVLLSLLLVVVAAAVKALSLPLSSTLALGVPVPAVLLLALLVLAPLLVPPVDGRRDTVRPFVCPAPCFAAPSTALPVFELVLPLSSSGRNAFSLRNESRSKSSDRASSVPTVLSFIPLPSLVHTSKRAS
jgi:hypothetical protein